MDQLSGFRVAAKLEQSKLLFARNSIAGLSIVFCGYDQGMMSGVNNAKDYIDLMGLGYVDEAGDPVITDSLLQGGIVSVYYLGTLFGCLLGGWYETERGKACRASEYVFRTVLNPHLLQDCLRYS
jgi:hypothetical protein